MRATVWAQIALAAVATPLPAQEWIASFDPSASEVSFVLQATGHQVRGVFSVRSGAIRWDASTGVASGEIVVNALGAETGNPRRDEKMHSEVLESTLFPEFSFRVVHLDDAIAAEGPSTVRLIGSLSVHGGEYPLTIDADVVVSGEQLNAVASFDVPYVDWGLRDPSVFVLRVAKSVAVTVELSGTLRVGEGVAATQLQQ
jgi:polyisoprenoid-binding protein YceI